MESPAADAPILIGYDGSDGSAHAVREAAALFAGRPALVATVWEQGLAYEVATAPIAGDFGMPAALPDPADAKAVDDASRSRAETVAKAGADVATEAGLRAEPLAVADELDVAETLVDLAEQRGAAAIVVGSRGLTGLRARLEGSTSNAVLKHAKCPVVVVHDD